MGKTNGPYVPEFPAGSKVRVASRGELEQFRRTWAYHNPLRSEQLEYADAIAVVADVSFYHGGDELYSLAGIPGLWHEQCLSRQE